MRQLLLPAVLIRQLGIREPRSLTLAWEAFVEDVLEARRGEPDIRERLRAARGHFTNAWLGELEPVGLDEIDRGIWFAGEQAGRIGRS